MRTTLVSVSVSVSGSVRTAIRTTVKYRKLGLFLVEKRAEKFTRRRTDQVQSVSDRHTEHDSSHGHRKRES